MNYALDEKYIGYPGIDTIIAAASVAAAVAAGQAPPPGFVAQANDKVWGAGEFMWARANGAIPLCQMVSLLPVWDSTNKTYTWNATAVANTANLGRMVGVSMGNAALASGDYGWFCITGIVPVSGTATVAADTAFGITAAGQVGAIAAGKQILNARIVTPATQTVVKVGRGDSGDNVIYVPDADGWFPGVYLSGTGVGASAIVSFVDPMGKFVRVTVNNSAAIAGNVTATYNNATIFYNVAHLNRSFAQGAIT